MRRVSIIAIIVSMAVLAVSSCTGGGEVKEAVPTARFLPKEISSAGITRTSDVRTFVGDSLWAYIDGGADVYYGYNFVDVATTDYQKGQVSFVADIYHFDSPLNAYGLYSITRSADSKLIPLGMEGCVSPGQLQFAKGSYLIRLTGFDDSDASAKALADAAGELAKSIPGTDKAPQEFSLFPEANKIMPSDKYFALSFLQERFLSKVFARSYQIDGDTVTLFYSIDEPGQKILQWSKLAEADKSLSHLPADIPYDEDKGFITTHKVYGPVMVGMKLGYMAGMVGYRKSLEPLLIRWLSSLHQS